MVQLIVLVTSIVWAEGVPAPSGAPMDREGRCVCKIGATYRLAGDQQDHATSETFLDRNCSLNQVYYKPTALAGADSCESMPVLPLVTVIPDRPVYLWLVLADTHPSYDDRNERLNRFCNIASAPLNTQPTHFTQPTTFFRGQCTTVIPTQGSSPPIR